MTSVRLRRAGARMLTSNAGRRVVIAAAALAGAVLTANLGAWQLRRADQKLERQRTLTRNEALPPLDASDWPAAGVAASATPWEAGRRVRLRGEWVASRAVYLENRQMNARVGFYLVMPLRLENRPDAVLVQRGWVPRDQADRTRLPAVDTPAGSVRIEGRMAPPPGRLFELAASSSGAIRQNLEISSFAVETGLPLQPGSVQQTDGDGASNVHDGLLRDWPLPAVDVQKNLGYAFQWYAMCALIVGLYVWFQLVRPRLRRFRPQ